MYSAGYTMLHLFLLAFIVDHLSFALTDEEKQIIVDKHNWFRSRTDPPAANMMRLSWDTSLEELASAYAGKCIWEHNQDRGLRGENLFLMTGSSLDVALGMEDWYKERNYYNFTTATCQEGQMCGHYTQIVWASTERVGCGDHFCEEIEGFDEPNVYFLVCNYEPLLFNKVFISRTISSDSLKLSKWHIVDPSLIVTTGGMQIAVSIYILPVVSRKNFQTGTAKEDNIQEYYFFRMDIGSKS
ncbi:peptidase inhibitor 16-like [Rhinophrynus dorsalis]